MNNSFQKECIERFITQIKGKYSDLNLNYSYNEEEDLFDIWHNSQELQFNNTDFLKFVGELLKELVYSQGIFNVSFGYDYIKANSNENNYIAQGKAMSGINPKITIFTDNQLKGFLSNFNDSTVRKQSFFDIENNTKVYYSKEDILKYNDILEYSTEERRVLVNTNIINRWEEELVA